MDQKSAGLNITIFFCQQLDANQDANRRVLERELGSRIKFFPLPCSGRIEPLHLLRALETGADRVYLIICPEGACRYREGNLRARKRLAFAQGLIEEIGLEPQRLELIQTTQGDQLTIDQRAHDLLARKAAFGPNPAKLQGSRGQANNARTLEPMNPGTPDVYQGVHYDYSGKKTFI